MAGEFVGHTIERLTVHHKASVLSSNTHAPAKARQHQKFHQDSGWPDVAYHFMVDAHGHVYEGRPTWAAGDTFTDYDPAGHFLVCGEGDFNQQALPQAQLEAMADVLAWAAVQFGVSPETIRGHRDYAATTCPGANLAPLVDDGTVRAMVEARLAAGTPSLVIGCGQDAYDLVAAIEAGTA